MEVQLNETGNGPGLQGSKALYIALIAGNCVASQSILLMPFLMGTGIDTFGLSEPQGGWLASTQLAAISVATLVVAPLVHRIDRRRVFICGLLLSILSNGISILSVSMGSVTVLFLSRALCGTGEGILIAMVFAVAAGTARPIKTFAAMNCGAAVFAALIYLTSPYLMLALGSSALFAMMLATALLSMPLARWVSVVSSSKGQYPASTSSRGYSRQAITALLMFGLFACVVGGTFAFAQRIGINSVGLGLERIGLIIGVAAILTISGPWLASLLGGRIGQSIPIISSVVIYAGVALCFAFADSQQMFIAAVLLHAVVAAFATTFLSAFLASLDASGRVAAAGPAFAGMGSAAGPSIMAFVIPLLPGYQAIGWVGLFLLLIVGSGIPGIDSADGSKTIRQRSNSMPLDQDVREVLDYIGARPVINAANSTLDELRRDKEEIEWQYDLPVLPMYQEHSQDIPGPNGSVPVRKYLPRRLQENERLPVLIFIHGGAWVFCSMDTHENMVRYLCMKGDVIGINVGYHLAPEHKFPAAIEDCYAVLEWTQQNMGLIGGIPGKICVAGDSAGGNIAAVLCLVSA